MRAIIIAMLISALAQSAYAQTTKSGFYAGIVGGYSHTDLDLEGGPVGGTPTQFGQSYLHAGEIGLVAGYQHSLPRDFFIGVEMEAMLSMGEESGLFNSALEVEKDGTFTLALKPGYEFNDRWSAFLTLGMQRLEYTARYAPAGYEESDSSAGFLHGAGVNYQLDEDVSLTMEYNRVQPLDLEYEYIPGVTGARFDPEIDMVKLALKYHF